MRCCCDRCHFGEPQNLVALGEYDVREKTDPGTEIDSISYLDYVDWRDQTKVFERVAIYTNQSVSTLTDGNEATHVQGEAISADLFQLLGIQPLLGRTFLPQEDEPGNHVVILSHGLWQRRFGDDRSIIGKSITLDGQLFQVIGVMPTAICVSDQRGAAGVVDVDVDLARIERRLATNDRAA